MKCSNLPLVQLHPVTIQYLKKGHPWVISDSYTAKFPSKSDLLIGVDQHQRPCAILLHDPLHKKIKARLWRKISSSEEYKNFHFVLELEQRLKLSLEKRAESQTWRSLRQNFYLAFGENDQLPGLFIQKFQQIILIQMSTAFWQHYLPTIVNVCKKFLENDSFEFWIQNRFEEKTPPYPYDKSINPENSHYCEEFGVKFKVHLGESYDQGWYTDMASIRQKIAPLFTGCLKVLNLYCYTGAFSLLAKKNEAKQIFSVDLSKKYLDWLKENWKLNQFSEEDHFIFCTPVEKFLLKAKQRDEKYDFIICDPPSFSSDGKKSGKAFDQYKELIQTIIELLSDSGKALLALNTHHITRQKFHDVIVSVTKQYKRNVTLTDFGLDQDCGFKSSFPESDYLKVFLLELK